MSEHTLTWRVGRTLGTTVYREGDAQPAGWFPGDPALAARVVGLLNAACLVIVARPAFESAEPWEVYGPVVAGDDRGAAALVKQVHEAHPGWHLTMVALVAPQPTEEDEDDTTDDR